MKVIDLKKVEVNSLIQLFSRSLKVSTVLDFKISSEKISSIVQNDASTFWKEWSTSTTGIFESEKFEEVEVLIYNGSFFKDKVLPLFSKSTDLTMSIELNDENHPVRIRFNDGTLAISFPTTRLELAQEKLTDREHEILFGIDEAQLSYELPVEVLSSINKLKSLSYSCADRPVTAITFESTNGVLRAMDGVFDLVIDSDFKGGDFSVKLDKTLLELINSEDNTVYLCPTEYNGQTFQRFVFASHHSSIKATDVAILLQEIDNEGIDDLGEAGNGWDSEF